MIPTLSVSTKVTRQRKEKELATVFHGNLSSDHANLASSIEKFWIEDWDHYTTEVRHPFAMGIDSGLIFWNPLSASDTLRYMILTPHPSLRITALSDKKIDNLRIHHGAVPLGMSAISSAFDYFFFASPNTFFFFDCESENCNVWFVSSCLVQRHALF